MNTKSDNTLPNSDAQNLNKSYVARLSDCLEKAQTWQLMLVVLIAWLISHPFVGIRHDAALYAGQALKQLFPEELAKDVFFHQGSQDDFTLVTKFYSALISQFGLGAAHMGLVTISQIAFLSAIYVLAKKVWGQQKALVAMAFLGATPLLYGGGQCLSAGEPFFTARSLSEPITILAVYFMFVGRTWISLSLLLIAAIFHPLMALPGLTWWYINLALENKKNAKYIFILPTLLLIACALAFPKLLATYDKDWWEWVEWANAWLVLPSHWQSMDWRSVVQDAAVLITYIAISRNEKRRFTLGLLLTFALSMLATALFAEILKSILITSIQLWRSHWLAHLIALLCLVDIIFTVSKKHDNKSKALSTLLCVTLLMPHLWAASATAVVALLIQLFVPEQEVSDKTISLLKVTSLITLFSGAFNYYILDSTIISNVAFDTIKSTFDLILAFSYLPLVSIVIVCVIFATFPQKSKHIYIWNALLIITFLALIISWDRRSEWEQELEAGVKESHPFSSLIPKTSKVYWDDANDGVWAPWILLHRESYYSNQQTSGLLFVRSSAEILMSRRNKLVPLAIQNRYCEITEGVKNQAAPCVVSDDVLDEACLSSDAPDFVVLRTEIKRPMLAKWKFPGGRRANRDVFLYSCNNIKTYVQKKALPASRRAQSGFENRSRD